jgi:hypothetical protein
MSAFRQSRAFGRCLAPFLPFTLAPLLCGLAATAAAQDGVPCPAEPTMMAVAYGDAVTCAHQGAADTDVFTFAGVTGEVIVVNALGACVTLSSPAGPSVEACAATLRNRIDAVLEASGTYTITTRVGPFTVAAYTVAVERLLPPSPGARLLHYEETVTDHINVAGDIDLFWFNGAVNDTISVLASTTAIMPPCLELIAPDNARSTACGFGQSHEIQVTLHQPGPHAILVRQGDTIAFSAAWLYSLRVRCLSGTCNTPPLPPTGLTGSVSTFATSLSWIAPSSGRPPTSYVVEAGTTSGATDVLLFDTLSPSTTLRAPGIPNGTYFVRVRSRNPVGTSGPSNEITISGPAGCALPPAPATFTAAASGLLVTLQWAAVAGGTTSYIVEAGSAPGGTDVANVDVGLTTQLTTPAPAGIYFVRIRARNACGLGAPSNEVRLVVGCAGPPSPPSTLSATVAGDVVTLTWPAAAGEPTAYSIEVGSAPGLSDLLIFDAGSRLTFAGKAPRGTYFVRVRARNACGASAPSVEQIVVVP